MSFGLFHGLRMDNDDKVRGGSAREVGHAALSKRRKSGMEKHISTISPLFWGSFSTSQRSNRLDLPSLLCTDGEASRRALNWPHQRRLFNTKKKTTTKNAAVVLCMSTPACLKAPKRSRLWVNEWNSLSGNGKKKKINLWAQITESDPLSCLR